MPPFVRLAPCNDPHYGGQLDERCPFSHPDRWMARCCDLSVVEVWVLKAHGHVLAEGRSPVSGLEAEETEGRPPVKEAGG